MSEQEHQAQLEQEQIAAAGGGLFGDDDDDVEISIVPSLVSLLGEFFRPARVPSPSRTKQ